MNKFVLSLLLFFSLPASAQFYSARTNMVGLVTGNMNVEFAMTMNKKISLHFPVQYNPFFYSKEKNTKFQNLTAMPGMRYWFSESFRDAFLGFSLVGSRYNIGNVWSDYRYRGYAAGMGLSFGRSYPVSPRWNLEWELGMAALWTTGEKALAKRYGYSFGDYVRWRLFPHKIALNLVYLF